MVGRRFDAEAARAEALAKRRAEKIRKIVSAATLVVLLLVLTVGGRIGWNWWQEKRAREAAAAEEARLAEERAEAERRRVENERREAERLRREAERKAAEERREAERKAREEAREAERKAREEARRAAEEARRREAENRVVQSERREYAQKAVGALRFVVDDHVVFQEGTDGCFDSAVDGRRWVELAAMAQAREALDFFETIRDGSVTNAFSESNYPDRETVSRLLGKLGEERFTLVVKLTEAARDRRFVVATVDPVRGVGLPEGCRELKSGGRLTGWTIPFVYGAESPVLVMDSRTADRIAREWNSLSRGIRRDAAKLTNRDEYVAERLRKELPDFLNSVRIELSTPPPAEKADDAAAPREIKPKATMKGTGDIRRMNGPHTRR